MPSNTTASDSVNRRFRRIVTVIYVAVLALVMWVLIGQWREYVDASEAQREYAVLQAALRAMALVSAERRPTFAILEQSEPASELQKSTLMKARQATDRQLGQLAEALRNPDCQTCPSQSGSYDAARSAVTGARSRLDALGQLPRPARTGAIVIHTFDEMMAAVPQLSSIAEVMAMGVIRQNADVQSYLLCARLAALLREHSGRLGSQFIPALSSHRPLTQEETYAIGQTLGRIEQLRALLAPSARGLPTSLRVDFDDMDRHYFTEALALIEQLRQDASRPEGAELTPAQFAAEYGPQVAFIDRFRDDALELAHRTIVESLKEHAAMMLSAGLLASALTGVLIVMTWRFREKIVRPFVDARRLILAIASGDLSIAVPRSGYTGEVKDMFGALDVLKRHSVERLRLEKERRRLIGKLRTMAETDALTGLLNRRAFESHASRLLSDQRGGTGYVALIMLDIDRFKRINDTYGHETGDRALVMLAALCRETVRTDDIVARIGGEEFTILFDTPGSEQAVDLAERIRVRLLEQEIAAVDGQAFHMTASFGIAIAERSTTPPLDELLRRADALLYQAKEGGRDRIEVDGAA